MLPISTQSSAFWRTGVHAQSQMAPSAELLMQCKHASISKTLQRTDSFPRADCGKVPYFIFRTVPCSFFSAPITSAHLPRNCWRCYGITLYLPALLSACAYVCACIYVSVCLYVYILGLQGVMCTYRLASRILDFKGNVAKALCRSARKGSCKYTNPALKKQTVFFSINRH